MGCQQNLKFTISFLQDGIPSKILNEHCWRRAYFRALVQQQQPGVFPYGEEGDEVDTTEIGHTFVHWVPMFFAAIAVSFYIPRYRNNKF